ncbi:hypothetical protein A3H80_05120 [Candidatus Roizmanbacteria bacterium RIFCSPLOWO2_02_FULL_37_19]|uniref:Methyltransferase domain-containing protein n=1 Tax=Candidatus Roizmanbacteria bacterium RIFCSPHIGHO2_02_FULL_37_24 TaxID=1802037 RepID=A0A1F7GVY0_9BACT|nr:MAG: hypothetical protein A2862_00825 [Candidatus Roizmanbacteria bacterium RIFCSPHIGHO2_01_FULL_38_41]OGK23230.1 MAG: hypothetical protein A3C24_01060 [Candidatus Roizmanbacteria bacterium RIFCSPHIGHO2_02_FULL_37_24]OGK33846.1 MAG: hypothetical protein A3E10_00190 [Candidatus Roizmanbacteria bacterium RIFCSPHIGHO2_12_FULL_37_23]OGK43871.1 MAG: hypothetical protein A2956_02875 [Candidatus Roizmanbacteria bacterium RIFCSPLOWO2_01_FULL_37_57]OGK54127.1 MAG: hypothetical protein A3H80_05120 [Ca
MLKKTVKNIVWKIKGGYEPQRFWDAFAESLMNDPWQKKIHPQHAWLLQHVKESHPQTILEIGCGFGRNIRFLIKNGFKAEKITGIDISPVMIQKAKKFVGDKVQLHIGDIRSLPYDDNEFDFVFTHGVFMHVSPQDVQKAMKECLRVTKKDFIIIEQNYPADNRYTFVHPYKKLFTENKVNIVEYMSDNHIGLDYYHVKIR